MTENKRIIKLRAWDGEKFYSPFFGASGKIARTFNSYSNGIFVDDPLMEFTGFLDKKGKEIYEDDIVRVHGIGLLGFVDYRIVWNEGSFWGRNSFGKLSLLSGLFDLEAPTMIKGRSKMEVVGDVWENPELLNQK